MTDNLSTFMSQFSRNLGASNSWNRQGLSGPVRGIALPLPFLPPALALKYYPFFSEYVFIGYF
jgi:hypothetical protein